LGELKYIREEVTKLSEGVKKVNARQRDSELYRLDVWEDGTSSQGSSASGSKRGNNQAFKDTLVTFYDRGAPNHPTEVGTDGNPLAQIRCMLLDKPIVTHKVCAAHIWRHSRADDLVLFGLPSTEINNLRNGLLLAKSIEVAFDKKQVCFLYNPFDQKFYFRVLDPALRQIRIYYPDAKIQNDYDYPDTFGSLDGKALQLPENVFPYKRLLGFHARCAFKAAVPKWIKQEQYQEFLNQESVVSKADGGPPWYSDGVLDPLDGFD
jgi:hypothetical protein